MMAEKTRIEGRKIFYIFSVFRKQFIEVHET